jgi:hypothetical protein
VVHPPPVAVPGGGRDGVSRDYPDSRLGRRRVPVIGPATGGGQPSSGPGKTIDRRGLASTADRPPRSVHRVQSSGTESDSRKFPRSRLQSYPL